MKITRINTYKNPDRVTRKTIFDLDRLILKGKSIPEKIGAVNEIIDGLVTKVTGRIINLFG